MVNLTLKEFKTFARKYCLLDLKKLTSKRIMKIKGLSIFIVLLLPLLFGGIFLVNHFRKNSDQEDIKELILNENNHIYFWSKECPHCTNVEKFFDTWELKEEFKWIKYEITNSRENYNLFLKTGSKLCNLSPNQLGVPLLITPSLKCILGDVSVIDYLKNLKPKT